MSRLIGFAAGILLAGAVFYVLMHQADGPSRRSAGPDDPEKPECLEYPEYPENKDRPAHLIENTPPARAPLTIDGGSQKGPGNESTAAGEGKEGVSEERVSSPGQPLGAEVADGRSWQVFWTPFRTKKSARGFAARIREVTGLDLDVQHGGSGGYRVAFSYMDEEERQAFVTLIENRTRLSLEGGESL